MKAGLTKLLLAFFILPALGNSLAAQQNDNEKTIVITKKRTDTDGSEVIETIIKKGEAAENFDMDNYLQSNRKEGETVEISVEQYPQNRRSRDRNLEKWAERAEAKAERWAEKIERSAERWAEKIEEKGWNNGNCVSLKISERGFLGVSEDEDENPNEKGVVVDVNRGSTAEKAGLRSNDLILKLDETSLTTWDDLSNFMKNTKPEQVVKVTFSRNGGTPQVVEVALSGNTCWKPETNKGFLGVSDYDDNDQILGVKIKTVKGAPAANAGLQNDDILLKLDDTKIYKDDDITDFMRHTVPGQVVQVLFRRSTEEKNVPVTLGASKDVVQGWNFNNVNWTNNAVIFNNKEKEACLGVYTGLTKVDDQQGPAITSFTSKSAAKEAEMLEGDLILSINSNRVYSSDELWEEIAAHQVGEKVAVAFIRNGQTRTIEATLKACKDKSSWVSIDRNNDCTDRDAFLGVTVVTSNNRNGARPATNPGILLSEVLEGSAAAAAGLNVGDVIYEIDDEKVDSYPDLVRILNLHKPGEKINIRYERANKTKTTTATLKSCKESKQSPRIFQTWNWNERDRDNFRDQQVITIRKGEGDAPAMTTPPRVSDRNLKLQNFRAFPNPTQGQITVEFNSESVPTTITLYELSGRQLFREELNGFNGQYSQQFDLSAYAKGTILIQIMQGEQIFVEQVVVN